MIEVLRGDVRNAKGIIVHGCNAQGVMGSGVAKSIRAKWPDAYDAYKLQESTTGLKLGTISWAHVEDGQVIVVNAITQKFYGNDGKKYVSYDALYKAFNAIEDEVVKPSGFGVNFPLIGCGLAGGVWSIVSAIINESLSVHTKRTLWVQ